MASVAVTAALPGPAATPLSGGLKRKRVDADHDETDSGLASSQPASSPIKRQKVTFKDDPDVKEIEDWNDKGMALVREEVQRGLQSHHLGDDRAYNTLQNLFVSKSSAGEVPQSRLLRKYITALTGSILSLKSGCSGFVKVLLDSDWLGRDEDYVAAYIRFLRTLISAHGPYLHRVLEMLVEKFIDLPPSAGRVQGHDVVEHPQLYGRVHQALESILSLTPAATATLSRVLADAYPYSKDSTKIHVEYASNVLQITKYAPEMRNFILGLLIERIVKLDVEIQIDLEDLEEQADEVMQDIVAQAAEKPAEDDLSDDEESDLSDDSDDEDESGAELTEEQKQVMSLKESVDKLDTLLDLLFGFYDSIFKKGPSYDSTDVFEHMMTQFKQNILPTYHSRYTQFIIFHFAQSDEQYVDRFVQVCWDVISDKTRPLILRLAASAYLGSFIARGARVSVDVVRYCVQMLVAYLDDQRRKFELQANGPDLRRFGSFYATFQVLIYIFCFRWHALLNNEDADDPETIMEIVYHDANSFWIAGLREAIQSGMTSTLNPFKICAPVIVEQFVRVSHNFKFVMAQHILQRNKTIRVVRPTVEASAQASARETALSGSLGDSLQLDPYFPFDPYHLPKSKQWLKGDYVEWEDPEGLKADGNSGQDGEDDEKAGAHVRDSSEERERERQANARAEYEEEEFGDESETDDDSD